MSSPLLLWNLIFLGLWAAFAFIIMMEGRRKLYFLYFLLGMVFGFYFDIVSFTSGYYSYSDLFSFKLLGLPVSMTVAEGFSVAIALFLFDKLKNRLQRPV